MAWRIAGINFDHFHMGDLLAFAHSHADAEIVAICDEVPDRMDQARSTFSIPEEKVYSDFEKCLIETQPDIVILCPAAARHAEWTEKVAPFGVHILMEKPFAASLAEADRMISAMDGTGKQLAINWPIVWNRSYRKCYELIQDGAIGEVREVHTYGGIRGPLWHGAGKLEKEPTEAEKAASWFYKESEGGGSMLDYLGYGTTLGTWFNGGKKPIEVMSMWDRENTGLEVDEHSITIARYSFGLSKFETRWGTFSDPWTTQPQPKCGFVIKGSEGTLSSYDYDHFVTLQDDSCPEGKRVDAPAPEKPNSNPVEYLIDCLENDRPIEGPLSLEISRIGQQIVDTAFESAKQGRALPLIGE
ncbi:MAG: glucose-fructose oxidoreductase [Verrucomicrobiales bacterium]|nr:glucose-fructose oxidoreductase [Verrucomicrobiales bacterium]